MSAAARRCYDNARIEYLVGEIIRTPVVDQALREVRLTMRANWFATHGIQGVALSGDSATGKTTICTRIGAQVASDFWDERGGQKSGFNPVVFVEVPTDPTPKTMGRLFHDALGIPYNPASTADILAAQARRQIEARCTRLVIVDEVHHLGARRDAAHVLKQFSNNMPGVTFIYAGLDLPGSGLLSGTAGQQVGNRFKVIETDTYYEAASEEWQRIVSSFAHQIVLSSFDPEGLMKLSGYLHKRCKGKIGHLSNLLRTATILAIDERDPGTMQETITRARLDQASLGYAADGVLSVAGSRQDRSRGRVA